MPQDTNFPLGTTYSCVANYEGSNVEISEIKPQAQNAPLLMILQSRTSRVHSPPHHSSPSLRRNDWLVRPQRTRLRWTQPTPSSISSEFTKRGGLQISVWHSTGDWSAEGLTTQLSRRMPIRGHSRSLTRVETPWSRSSTWESQRLSRHRKFRPWFSWRLAAVSTLSGGQSLTDLADEGSRWG